MAFVQLNEYTNTRQDELEQVFDEWLASTEGKRTAQRAVVGLDRERPNTYIEVIEFPSYEEAMKNSSLPETNAVAEKMAKLCDTGPTFRNLDVVLDRTA